VLNSDFLNDKVGIDMTEKEPKSTSMHSYMEPHERLNVISWNPNFRCFVGLPSCGSGFLKGLLPCEFALSVLLPWALPCQLFPRSSANSNRDHLIQSSYQWGLDRPISKATKSCGEIAASLPILLSSTTRIML
jgi:hypothetical protein